MPINVIPNGIEAPQIAGALQNYGQGVQLKSLIQQTQMQDMQMQQEAQKIKDQQAMTASMQQWDGKWETLPGLVQKNGGSANAVIGLKKGITEQQKNEQALTKDKIENMQAQNDAIMAAHTAVDALPPEQRPAGYQQQLQNLSQVPGLDVSKFPPQYPGDEAFKQFGAGLAGTAARLTALARDKAAGKTPEGEIPLGQNATQFDKLLDAKWQAANPGQTRPPEFGVTPQSTQKDYDRINQSLQSVDSTKLAIQQHKDTAAATAAQRQFTNSLASQAAADRRNKTEDASDKAGRKPVIGTDPKTGRPVLVPASQASEMGVTDAMDASADIVNKSHAARAWLTMATKQGDGKSPDSMGILQLIDKLDKRGKLGALASRWNEFLAGKVGAGDPDFAALRTKMGLSNTKLMQAHVGSRGGAFMLEHFEQLANDKKMDASTLREGVKSEVDYMKDVAMEPGQGGNAQQSTTQKHQTLAEWKASQQK